MVYDCRLVEEVVQQKIWPVSSVGRASRLHREGFGGSSPSPATKFKMVKKIWVFQQKIKFGVKKPLS